MGRPRSYDETSVVEAARDTFWQHGYELASIGELEERTGLKRSSLYQAFGSKRGLFEAALRNYIERETEPTLSRMRQPNAGLKEVLAYFKARARGLRTDPQRTARGCLVINTIAEFGTRDPAIGRLGEAHRKCVHDAFHTALRQAAACGEVDAGRVATRAEMLVSAAIGISLTARVDLAMAADASDAVAAEVAAWREP
jgi:AcrR family transcriptional regulator